MVYRVIGVVSGNSTGGLDLLFTEFTETGGKWSYEVLVAKSYGHDTTWREALSDITNTSVLQYQQLHAAFGKYAGEQVMHFIEENKLEHRVHLVAFHGYTAFNFAGSASFGHGAFVAGQTGLPVVSDIAGLDISLGGSGKPFAGVAEKLLGGEDPATAHPEAVVVALMGVLRWREEANMLAAATGARKDSIGGALWLGTDA